jgi:EpsI family protein
VLLLYALDGGLARVIPSRPPKPTPRRAHGVPDRARLATATVLAALVGLSFLPPWDVERPRLEHLADQLPREIDGYTSTDIATDRIFLGQAGFSELLHREYTREGWRIDVFVARAALTLRNRSFHSPKTAVPGSGWIVEESSQRELAGRSVLVRVVRRGTRRLMIFHWQERSPGLLAETLRTALALDASPWRRKQTPVVVRLMVPVSARPGSRTAAEARLTAFLAALAPRVRNMTVPEGEAASTETVFSNMLLSEHLFRSTQ